MSELINNFNALYHKTGMNPPNTGELYDKGCNIIYSNVNNTEKINIIYKLLPLYPNEEYILCYWMGTICSNIEPYNAYYWFNRSYHLEPLYIENLLDLFKWLFDRDYFDKIQKILEKHPNIYKMDDIRMLLLLASYEAKMKHYYLAIDLYKKILENTLIPIDIKLLCNTNIGVVYNDVGGHTRAIFHLDTALQIYENNKKLIDKKMALHIFRHWFLINDYIYYDINLSKPKHTLFNSLITQTNDYIFTKKNPNTKIKIGYLSGDFINHAVSRFIQPILKYHTNQFEIHCLSLSNYYEEHIFTNCIYHNVLDLQIHELSDYIYKLKIDILFDLAGHTTPNRIDVFGLNSAPIQIAYLGYPNTTGLSSIKYRITDNIADPPLSNQIYIEKMYKLPKCFLLYNISNYNKNIHYNHKDVNTIILGSLNKENKTSIYVLNVWKQILKECPSVKLLILCKSDIYDEIIERTNYYSKLLNVSTDRLIITPHQKTENEYMNLFTKIDILLDTFPYSGTTTTCNALISSIPVITKYHKDYHAHNVSASLLINSGLKELVAYSDEEYIQIVKSLVENPSKIKEYKNTIQEKFVDLMEPTRFMETYEKTLIKIYENEYK
jgi:protein O-GlcNAc transferase